MTGTVHEGSRGRRWVEVEDGFTTRSFEHPDSDAPEGTEVNVEPYMGIGDVRRAELSWIIYGSTYHVFDAREV